MQHKPTAKRTAIPTIPQRWRSVHIRPSVYLAVVLVVFLGVIGAAQAAGWGCGDATARVRAKRAINSACS